MRALADRVARLVRDVPATARPVREHRRPDHARGLRDDRPRPVRAHDDPRRDRLGRPGSPVGSAVTAASVAVVGELDVRRRGPRRTSAPHAAARSSSAGSSADRSKPTAGSPPASAPYVSSNVVPGRQSPRASRGSAARPAPASSASSPACRSSATAAGEANTPPARQRHAGRPLEQHDVVARAGPGAARDRARGPAAHDDDVRVPAHALAGSGVGAGPVALELAHRDRRDRDPVAGERADLGDRPQRRAAASSARSSTRVYARRTDSGPSWRVYRLRVVSGEQDPGAEPVVAGPDEVVDDDARAARAAPPRAGTRARPAARGDGSRARRGRRRTSGPARAATARRRHDELEARRAVERAGRRPGRRRAPPAASRRRSPGASDPTRDAASSSASGMSAPPVPTSSSVCGTVRPGEQPVERAPRRRRAAEPAVDPGEVAQVARAAPPRRRAARRAAPCAPARRRISRGTGSATEPRAGAGPTATTAARPRTRTGASGSGGRTRPGTVRRRPTHACCASARPAVEASAMTSATTNDPSVQAMAGRAARQRSRRRSRSVVTGRTR